MRSLRALVMVTIGGALVLALFVFLAISNRVQRVYLYPVFEAMDELEVEQAVEALGHGGATALSGYLTHLDQLFGVQHYLLLESGADAVSGRDLRGLLPRDVSQGKSRAYVDGKWVITHRSQDGRYWFVAVDARQTNRWTFFPYYLLVLGVTGLLYWVAAVKVLHPVQKIATALDDFGRGEMFTRLHLTRQDEIGRLARSFDEMARRIDTLRTSERRLLLDLSHELRSPLTRLKFAVALAKAGSDGGQGFERVEREVNRITALVAEIMELTRVEGDPTARKLEMVPMEHLVAEITRDCEVEAELRGCRLEVRNETAAMVQGDWELLRRAVENVVRNAIRYAPEGSTVQCELRRDGRWVVVGVRDFGQGVPEDMLARIFEPFFRVDSAREGWSGGVGLGLAIAKRAVDVHEGTMEAQNAGPGLRVLIRLPAEIVNVSDTLER